MHFQRHLIARKYSLSLQRACTIISEGFNKWNVTRKKYSSLRSAEALINITLSAFPLVPRIPSRWRANFTIDRTELLHGFLANCVTFILPSPLFSTPFPSITISCYFAIYIVKRKENCMFRSSYSVSWLYNFIVRNLYHYVIHLLFFNNHKFESFFFNISKESLIIPGYVKWNCFCKG